MSKRLDCSESVTPGCDGFGQLVGEVREQITGLDRAAQILVVHGFTDTARIVTATARQIERAGVAHSESASPTDTERLNWLERMVVEVRSPLQWGSRQLFIANPVDVEGREDDPSDIRAQIDYQRNGGKKP